MYVIGLTGGVGSGKSVAAELLAKTANAKLLIADDLGHVAMEKGSAGYKQIVEYFGEGILGADKEIDRRKLSEIVFGKEEKLQILNQIIHPQVKEYIRQEIETRKDQEGFLVLENAIMFETGCDKFCQEIWYIAVSEEIRRQRLERDRGYSREKSDSIMKKQLSQEEFAQKCHRILPNNGTVKELEKRIKEAFLQVSGGK